MIPYFHAKRRDELLGELELRDVREIGVVVRRKVEDDIVPLECARTKQGGAAVQLLRLGHAQKNDQVGKKVTKKIIFFPPAMRSALLVLIFAAVALAANSTFSAQPNEPIWPYTTTSKLRLDSSYLVLDLPNGLFYLNATVTYSSSSIGPGQLPPITLVGNVYLQSDGTVAFAYRNQNASYCQQAQSSPPMCPFLQTLTSGAFKVVYQPTNGDSLNTLAFAASSNIIDPNTGKLMNFLGAASAFTYTCLGVCESIVPYIPPVPVPENVTVIVRQHCDVEGC